MRVQLPHGRGCRSADSMASWAHAGRALQLLDSCWSRGPRCLPKRLVAGLATRQTSFQNSHLALALAPRSPLSPSPARQPCPKQRCPATLARAPVLLLPARCPHISHSPQCRRDYLKEPALAVAASASALQPWSLSPATPSGIYLLASPRLEPLLSSDPNPNSSAQNSKPKLQLPTLPNR
ncbi:hypothetical protein BCR34DRAFT_272012 [Clohesyomyces aquaticus]|uniref:Uncharacterized protein n=1 Tax=Clohesyomyces aquaticus TaxID=1231657 RepID=A0A1Y1ZSP3_9PLEO|nr:hypothetical protein BCR34DRAFT_272012 [Clohesyomyces aquaticus]